ncbi:hypothetical protein CAAN3_01S02652 [[Candida] anglica]
MDSEEGLLDIIESLEAPYETSSISRKIELSSRNKQGIEQLDKLLGSLVPYLQKQQKVGSTIDPESPLVRFIALQDSFEYNVTSSLLQIYKTLSKQEQSSNNPETTQILLTCNRLLQGLLLIHPPSRKLFSRKENMKLILHFINEQEQSENQSTSFNVIISFISTLVHILLKNLNNFRTFESCDGCPIVIQKLNLQELSSPNKKATVGGVMSSNLIKNQQDLNFKLIEFLLFYLVDENEVNFDYSTISSAKKLSVTEKAELFRDVFPGIDALVENLDDLKNL